MGWADCGTDSKGRPIGYAFAATCDHPGCKKKIDRGLSYACGGMHGTSTSKDTDFESCEGYFCSEHLNGVEVQGESLSVCATCYVEALEFQVEWQEDEIKELRGQMRELTRWLFGAACDGGDIYGSVVQEKLIEMGLIEERSVDPKTNEHGMDRLYFIVGTDPDTVAGGSPDDKPLMVME